MSQRDASSRPVGPDGATSRDGSARAVRSKRTAGSAREAGARALVLALLVVSVGFFAGCEEDAGPLPDNIPPQTYLLIQGADLDTTNYRQILRWWGSDPDGRVIGYCIHWDGGWTPLEGSQRCAFDEEFVFTTATVDTFIVPTEGNFAERTFRVHAVDDVGVIDPTGKAQLFRLGNWSPEVAWSATISRPSISLPAVTFACTATDLDGNATVDHFLAWLDGEDPQVDARTFTDSLFALGVDDFGERFGERTLYVQAVDEARTGSNVIEHTWTVEPPPVERLLLIDSISSRDPGQTVHDRFYRAIMDSIAPSDYFVYDIEERGDFRSREEVGPLFDLFEGVLWYGGGSSPQPLDDASLFHNLGFAEGAIPDYLDSGGDLLLIYQDAVGDSSGALSADFAEDVAGIDGFYRYLANRENNIQVPRGMIIGSSGLAPGDSLETTVANTRTEFLIPASDADALFWVPPGFLDPTLIEPEQTEPALIGIATSRRTGRFGLVTFLLSGGADRRRNATEAAVNVARDVLE